MQECLLQTSKVHHNFESRVWNKSISNHPWITAAWPCNWAMAAVLINIREFSTGTPDRKSLLVHAKERKTPGQSYKPNCRSNCYDQYIHLSKSMISMVYETFTKTHELLCQVTPYKKRTASRFILRNCKLLYTHPIPMPNPSFPSFNYCNLTLILHSTNGSY